MSIKLQIILSGGGTGFIGSQLIKSLSLEGVSCTCISRMPGPNRISWVNYIRTNLRMLNLLMRINPIVAVVKSIE